MERFICKLVDRGRHFYPKENCCLQIKITLHLNFITFHKHINYVEFMVYVYSDIMNDENNVSEIIFHCNDSYRMSVINSTVAHINPATWYTDLYRICAVIINCFIFLTGMVGNILVCIVVLRTRSMRTPTNCYLVNLAIADILVLLSATLPAITETFFQIDEWPFGRVMCSSLVFLQYLGVDSSAMFITAFTVERYIAICHPLQSHAMCTVNRAKRIIAGIWIFGILYCSPWLGLTVLKRTVRTTGTVELCSIRLERHQYSAYYMADLMVFYVIPLILSVVLYALIARNLFLTSLPKANGHHQNEMRKGKKKVISSKMQVSAGI